VLTLAIIEAPNKNKPVIPIAKKRIRFFLPDLLVDLSNEVLLPAREAAAKLKNGKA